MNERFKKLVKTWFPITIVFTAKMKEHCIECERYKYNECNGCKFLKLSSLLEEIKDIIVEDEIIQDFYDDFEKIEVYFSNVEDEIQKS